VFSQLFRYGLKTVDAARIVVSIFTIPGTILHEIAHACGCWLTGTEIYHIQFWQWQNYLDWEADEQRGGFVRHASPHKPWYGVLISALPLALCFSCGALLYVLADKLPFWDPLVPFAFGSIFIYHMSLSDSDIAGIEHYTAELSGFEATVRNVFIRGSQSNGLPVVSIVAGVFFVFDISLWTIGSSLIWYALLSSLFLVYDWWQAR